jgi:hypothetical protein
MMSKKFFSSTSDVADFSLLLFFKLSRCQMVYIRQNER